MIHHTCDRCKRVIDTEHDMRYTVRIELQAVFDPVSDECEDDRDHLLEVHEILERMESDETMDVSPLESYQQSRFDLCSECQHEFLKNPLGQKDLVVGFSQN